MPDKQNCKSQNNQEKQSTQNAQNAQIKKKDQPEKKANNPSQF